MSGAMTGQKTYRPLRAEDFPPILFPEIFGNDGPVEVEIGCGKGKFLLARAQENPELNFLGLDYAGKWMRIGQTRGEKRDLRNLKFMKGEAGFLLGRLRPESVAVFHIYFPDPWPKRRHQKRRLITAAFLERLCGLLRRDGLVEIATDSLDYYEAIRAAVGATRGLWAFVRESPVRVAYETAKTSYEIKYETQKRPLYYLELKK